MTETFELPPLSNEQQRRVASASIAGYLYQFERSIVEILQLSPHETCRVEGIEDVDLWGPSPSTIQIKYYEAQSWSLSGISDAVLEMLRNFNSDPTIRYILYVHYGNGKTPPSTLTINQLKDCLTHRPRGENQAPNYLYDEFSQSTLEKFVQSFSIRNGVSLDEQRVLTSSELAKALDCSIEEAEVLHRMRAVHLLQEIATYKEEARRQITRADLLNRLDVKDYFYNKWHKQTVGQGKFLNAIDKKLRALEFNNEKHEKGLFLEVGPSDIDAATRLIVELANDLDAESKRRTIGAKPWTVIVRDPRNCLAQIKERLIEELVPFNDGYESIRFSYFLFSQPPVVNSKSRSDRLGRISYTIRIISEQALQRASEEGFQLTRVVALSQPTSLPSNLSKTGITAIRGLDIPEFTQIIRRILS